MRRDPYQVRFIHLVALLFILILAAVLRFHAITRQSLSGDELGTMETAAGRGQIHLTLARNTVLSPPPADTTLVGGAPVWKVATLMAADVHPPLYFVTLRLWQDFVGGGDFAARSLSVVFGLVGVLLIFDLGRWLGDTGASLWAALLMAVSSPMISIAQDARPYSMAVIFLLAAGDALIRIQQLGTNRPRIIALVAALAAACLTHYFVLPVVLAMGIYALALFPGQLFRRTTIAFVAAAAIFILLWGLGLWHQRKNFTDPWMYWFNENTPDHVAVTMRRLAILPLRFLADPPNGSIAAYGAAIVYLLPWLLVRAKPRLLLPALWLTGCVGLVLALDLARKTNQLDWIKYTVFAAPAVFLILPMLLDKRLRWLVAAPAAIYMMLSLPMQYPDDMGGFRLLAANIDRLASADDPVIFVGDGWGNWYSGVLYMGFERYAARKHQSVVLLSDVPSSDVEAAVRKSCRGTSPRCWIVMAWSSVNPNHYFPDGEFTKISNHRYSAMLYEMRWVDHAR